MRLMLDTNIIVDVLSKRDGYEESLQLVKYCELGKAEGFVSAITVTDVMYILRKHITPSLAREAMQTLLLIVNVANVLKSDITSGFSSDMKDYEDAVQASCAERMKADYIVTRNINDFAKSPIPAILPNSAINIITNFR
ncbi:MAG: PIN domain-containing protein [Clostridia bacterium]|nr:PIN domain-containing protein [Clostridia bacterium]